MTRASRRSPASDLARYSRAAQRSSALVLREYSTSFGAASRLLPPPVRRRIQSIYGLVRIADEVVDGAASEAGLDVTAQGSLLDHLERDTLAAIGSGYSTNPVVHAFADTARRCGIGSELITPFFASMRRDLTPVEFTSAELDAYVYGSAEVVGLMCLHAFLAGRPVTGNERLVLESGARRLGAAFQKINFLRDLSSDWSDLGRAYFPGVDPARLTEQQKHELVGDIRADLDAAAAAVPLLPRDCRAAVAAAHGLFSTLTDRVRRTPAAELLRRRVRVPVTTKLAIACRASLTRTAVSSS